MQAWQLKGLRFKSTLRHKLLFKISMAIDYLFNLVSVVIYLKMPLILIKYTVQAKKPPPSLFKEGFLSEKSGGFLPLPVLHNKYILLLS